MHDDLAADSLSIDFKFLNRMTLIIWKFPYTSEIRATKENDKMIILILAA
jgi:hypothetical protein